MDKLYYKIRGVLNYNIMKYNILLAVGLQLFIVFSTHSQVQNPVLVLSVDGSVQSKSEDGTITDLSPGVLLKNNNEISINKPKDSVLLFHNRKFFKIGNIGNYKLMEISKLASEPSLSSFEPLFGEFLKSSIIISIENNWNFAKKGDGWGTKPPVGSGGWGTKPPVGSGGWGTKPPVGSGGWGTKPPVGSGGWGKEAMTLETESPGGFYKNEKTTFSWLKSKKGKKYEFCIFDEDLKLIFSKKLMKTTINVDLKSLNLDTKKVYYWQVIVNGNKEVSQPIDFQILSDDRLNEIMQTTNKSELFASNNAELKGLILAVIFESNHMYYEANSKYAQLLKKIGNSGLIKMNYAAFCLRLGQTEKSKSIMEKN